ncbi:MAG: hypothetical protein V4498_04250 [candidate division FCPU426 bacterium]
MARGADHGAVAISDRDLGSTWHGIAVAAIAVTLGALYMAAIRLVLD